MYECTIGDGYLSIHDLTRRSTNIDQSMLQEMAFQFTTSQGGRRAQAKSD